MPYTIDADTAGFFEAAREGHLVVRSCSDCGANLHPPRQYCRHCGGWNTRWRKLTGRATLVTWTIVEQQMLPTFEVPYTVVLVEPDEAPGVRFVGSLPGRVESLQAGMAMAVTFETVGDGVVLPQWSPTE